jgi:phosphoglycerate dehydrogenase-like enzyme
LRAHTSALELFDAGHLERAAAIGTLLDPSPVEDWSSDRANRVLGECEVILAHWGCPAIGPDVLDRAPNLSLIAYAAGSVKGTVHVAAWDRGVRVTSGARGNAEPVAQFTLASIIFAGKRIPSRLGSTDPRATLASMTLDADIGNYDVRVGIVGASLIGRRVIELLGELQAVEVVVYDPYLLDDAAQRLDVRLVGLDELCAMSDVVSIHAPATPETQHMIGPAQLASMRDGATLINTARGSLVDHSALVGHVRSGRLDAILDVTDPEPLPIDHELRGLSNVWLTPHLAGSQGRELRRLADDALGEIERWASDQPALHEVRREVLDHIA